MNPTASRPTPWIPEFVLLAAIWGASFLFTRMGTVEFGVWATAGLRVVIATLFLLPILLIRGHSQSLREHWKLVLLVGITNSAIPFVCFSFALQSITVGLSSLLNATVPLFGAVIAWVWLSDRPSGSRMLGLAIGFLGVAMLAWDKASFKPDASGLSSGWGVLACLFACFCYGISASFTKRFLGGLPSLVSSTGSQLGAALALLPLTIFYWPSHEVSLKAWGAVITLGVVCTGFAYILFFRLIERAGPAKALSVTFAIPVFAVLYGVILLGETVTPWMVGCGLVIVLGTTLSTGILKLPILGWSK
ncbi:MAG: DMT family transporter [Sulfuritalea sp.]|nr:DMT family transporter [Sulfuritalea sp.]